MDDVQINAGKCRKCSEPRERYQQRDLPRACKKVKVGLTEKPGFQRWWFGKSGDAGFGVDKYRIGPEAADRLILGAAVFHQQRYCGRRQFLTRNFVGSGHGISGRYGDPGRVDLLDDSAFDSIRESI